MPLSNRVCFLVNLRDRLSCRVCSRAPLSAETYHRGFEYHHVVPRSAGGADETENVILLCHDCHTRHHQNRLVLPHFDNLTPPETLICHDCQSVSRTQNIEMNCGWYRCEKCNTKTHLFAHCGYAAAADG